MTDNVIDLDAILGEIQPRKVIVNKKSYWANPDPPVGLMVEMYKLGAKFSAQDPTEEDADAIIDGIRRVLAGIFGDEDGTAIFDSCGLMGVMVLLGKLMEAYSAEGKAPGSSRASRRSGDRSKPTSNANTRSTSAKRASVSNGSVASVSRS